MNGRHKTSTRDVGTHQQSTKRRAAKRAIPFFAPALLGALLLWLAFPPCGLWPLAWFAPALWVRYVTLPQLEGKHPYRMFYLVGLLHALLMFQWVRLPHWSTYFGWLALAIYLAVYLPLFVWLSRILVQRLSLPAWFAAPVVWTGLEYFRSHFLTGLAIALLGHSQVPWLPILQLADVTGAYGISFVVMCVAACLERCCANSTPLRQRVVPLLVTTSVLTVSLGYGYWQLTELSAHSSDEPPLRVALIQGSFDTIFDNDLSRTEQAFRNYVDLTNQAVQAHSPLDLIVWPESMFAGADPMISFSDPIPEVPEWEGSRDELREQLVALQSFAEQKAKWMAEPCRTPLLVGTPWDHYGPEGTQRFNSALMISSDGTIVGRYDKMHPVMFGEYIPLGNWFPWLYRLTPMPHGLTAGEQPMAFQVRGKNIVPTICFENTVPHLMRRQLRELQQQGIIADVLVTVTNDGWFWGSSLLDLHLACGVLRAIELRKPTLIAANTGFSASIEPTGRITAKGPRRQSQVVFTEVTSWPVSSSYAKRGDWFAGGCLVLTLLGAVGGWWRSRQVPGVDGNAS